MRDLLGSLFSGISGLLGIAAVVLLLYVVFGNDKIGHSISDLTMLQTNSQTLYNGQNSFATLTDAVAIAGKLAPTRMINGAALINPWNGAVTINVNAGNPAQFDITTNGLPSDACSKHVGAFNTTVVGMSINGVAQVVPVDAGAATAACAAAANTMVFTFSH